MPFWSKLTTTTNVGNNKHAPFCQPVAAPRAAVPGLQAKGTGLSRNTIRKWVRDAKEGDEPEYRRKTTPGKLSAFHAALELALTADALRTKQYRRTARALFKEIETKGYTGGYSAVTDFIREWRGTAGRHGMN